MASVSATVLKVGSASAVAGAAMLLIATLLHPMRADPNEPAVAFAEYAADRIWIATHLAQLVGAGLIFVGLHAFNRSLGAQAAPDSARWLADLALAVALAAFAATAILQAIDGVALKAAVGHWAAAPDSQKPAAFEAALAVRRIEIGAASVVALLFGTAAALFGLALLTSAAYPVWLGWIALGSGLGTVAGGLLTALTGFSQAAMTVGMPSNLLLIAWVAATGVVMWRQASSPATEKTL
jgi:hypothetical protein